MSTAAENQLVQAALEYASYGWRVIPLHNLAPRGGCTCRKGAKCPTPGKHPRLSAWQKAATTDEEVIAEWWEQWPKANVGVVFGKDSGIIDAECDSEEEQQILFDLFGGEIPPTVSFKSSRGRHWLFLWRDDLPLGGVCKAGALAIRVGNDEKGAMSVFPPSQHPSGKQYQWVVAPTECEVAEIPDEVAAKLANQEWDGKKESKKKSPEHWERVTGSVKDGQRNNSIASVIGKLLRMASSLGDDASTDVIWQSVQAINERYDPPLSQEELRNDFLGILKREQLRRANEQTADVLPHLPEEQVDQDNLRGFRLVIVRSDPPLYELHASQFGKAEGGCLTLTAKQLISPLAIKIEALEQAEYPLPKWFSKVWDGYKDGDGKYVEGLYIQLVRNAEHKDAPAEQKRHAVVAELLLSILKKARHLTEGQQPDSRGRPVKTEEGSVLFGFTRIWEDLSRGADKILRTELSRLLERVGATDARGVERMRLKQLSSVQISKLEQIARGSAEDSPTHENHSIQEK